MKVWTVHHRPGVPVVLVREAFSWTAALFGPLWLIGKGALPWGLAALAAEAAAMRFGGYSWLPAVALFPFWGFWGNDLWRAFLSRHGFVLRGVVCGPDRDQALLRLFDREPQLLREELR